MSYKVGDRVEVLSAIRAPKLVVIRDGFIERINGDLYWISGFPCARTREYIRHPLDQPEIGEPEADE